MDENWIVVKFIVEDTVEAVPTKWLQGNKCYWPPFPERRSLIEAIKKKEESVPENWQMFEVAFFRNNVFDNYAAAVQKAKKATICSDLESDNALPLKRRRIVVRRFRSSSMEFIEGEEMSILPTPPVLKNKKMEIKGSGSGNLSVNNDKQKKCSSSSQPCMTVIRSDDSYKSNPRTTTVKNLLCSESNVNEQMSRKEHADADINFLEEAMSSSEPLQAVEIPLVESVSLHPVLSKLPGTNVMRQISRKDFPDHDLNDQHLNEKELLIKLVKKQNIQNGLLMSINEKLQKLEREVSNLKSSVLTSSTDEILIESVFMKFNFPLTKDDTLQEFEEYLKNQEEFVKTKNELSRLSGENHYDCVVRILEKLITNKFASEFSYYGRKQKKAFNKLIMNQLVLKAGLIAFKDKTENDFEKAIMKWLKRAKERKQSVMFMS